MHQPLDSPLDQIIAGGFAPVRWQLWPRDTFRVVDWNINRGLRLTRVIEFLQSCRADLILLQEVDSNARRTHHLDVAREIAQALKMNYVFAREFQELTQGSRLSPAYHGQATLSAWPLSNPRILRFQKQSNFWRPHWFVPEISPFQERIGGRLALVVEAKVADKTIVTYNLHLESKGDDELRCSQLDESFSDARHYDANRPILLAGDLNIDASQGPAAGAITRAHFLDAFANQHVTTRPAHSVLDHGRIIDWILTRGPARARRSQVHCSVAGSDHFPLSIDLDFA